MEGWQGLIGQPNQRNTSLLDINGISFQSNSGGNQPPLWGIARSPPTVSLFHQSLRSGVQLFSPAVWLWIKQCNMRHDNRSVWIFGLFQCECFLKSLSIPFCQSFFFFQCKWIFKLFFVLFCQSFSFCQWKWIFESVFIPICQPVSFWQCK